MLLTIEMLLPLAPPSPPPTVFSEYSAKDKYLAQNTSLTNRIVSYGVGEGIRPFPFGHIISIMHSRRGSRLKQ